VILNVFSDRYQRLAKNLFGLSSLWLGEDHLVYVKGSGFLMPFTEEYKRFQLSEIQAVNVAKTSRLGMGLLYLFILLVCALVITLVLVFTQELRPAAVVVLSIFIAVALATAALLLRHLILGPTCVCDLQTRLTRERLTPLNRYHRALETVRRVEGLVRESQRGIVAGGAEETREGLSVRHAGSRATDFYQIPRPVPAVFALFLGLGLASLSALHLESLVLTGGILFLLVAASLLLTLSLVSVVRKPTPESIRAVLWVLLGLHFFVIGIGTVYFLIAATREPAYTVGLAGPLEAFTALASEGGMILYGVFVGLFLGFSGAGLWGLLLAGKWKRQIRFAATLAGTSTVAEKGDTV